MIVEVLLDIVVLLLWLSFSVVNLFRLRLFLLLIVDVVLDSLILLLLLILIVVMLFFLRVLLSKFGLVVKIFFVVLRFLVIVFVGISDFGLVMNYLRIFFGNILLKVCFFCFWCVGR